MTTTETTRGQLSTWTFVLGRDFGAEISVMATGAVFGEHGPAVLCWRDPRTRKASTTQPTTVTTLRHIIETMCNDMVNLMWESGGPATVGAGVHTDYMCRICGVPMVEYHVDHGMIATEGHCTDCGTREVWTLTPKANTSR